MHAPAPMQDDADRGGPKQPLLSVEGLVKHFKSKSGFLNRSGGVVRAVDDVGFSIRKGETLGVVGESGCGKSTTARVLMHLIEPDAGQITFDGDPVGHPGGVSLRDIRRQMQMVFQDSYSSLNPRLSIRDTIAFGPKAQGVPARQAAEQADRIMESVGLTARSFAHRYPHELSGGQRQRVNIARALAMEPRLLILDEAVSALDKSVEAQVLNLLVDLKNDMALTYMFISHDLNVVRYISDRVMVMYLGEVVEIGPVEDVFNKTGHPYTSGLIAAMPSLDPDRRTTRSLLEGDPPNPIDPPTGCRFHTRCPFAEAVCKSTKPRAAVLKPDHVTVCHMADPLSGHTRAGMGLPHKELAE